MPPQAARRIAWTACFILVFLSAFFLSGTQPPPLELDPSWHAAIEYATAHHLQFGTEIVFTFGPLGFLSTRTSLGLLLKLRIAFSVFWSAIVALAAIDIAKRLQGWIRILFIAWLMIFVLSSGLDQTAFFVLACGTILILQSNCAERWQLPIFVFAFILLSLIKFTFAMAALGSLALIVVCWAVQRKIGRAIVLALVAPAGFVACWAALGQSPSHIPVWFKRGFELASGYSGAMSLVPKSSVLCAALATLALFVWTLIATLVWARRNLLTWSILITVTQYVFLAWKEGFTRAGDWHTFVFLWFLPLGLILLFAVGLADGSSETHRRVLGISLVTAMTLCLLAANLQIPGLVWRTVTAWPRRALENTGAALAVATGRARGLYSANRNISRDPMLVLDRAKDVIGQDSMDVMNYLLLAAVANGMNYQPRPVIQGFVAYTPVLQELNAAYFRSASRPRYVLLAHEATDGRFTMLEDSAALNYVLNNYVPVARDGAFLVLQQRTAEGLGDQLVHEENLRFGEKLDLRPWIQGPLFMSADITPTLPGRALDFFFQRPPLYMRIGFDDSEERFRIVPSMAELPFLISPVLKTNHDTLNFLTSQAGSEPESLTFDPPKRGSVEFEHQIHVRLYTARDFPHASREVPASRVLADVQGRAFWPDPESVEGAARERVFVIQGTPALMIRAPSKIDFQIPEIASSFSGYCGIPEEAETNSEASPSMEVSISIEDHAGHRRQVFDRIFQPQSQPSDRGRLPFRVPIDGAHDRTLTLVTNPLPRGTKGNWSFWSQCRFDPARPK